MTNVPSLLARLSDTVGWGLIHFLWQGTLLAVMLGLVLLVLPRGFARARYVAGCVTLGLMLLAPAVTIWQLADPHDPASPYFEDVQASALLPEPSAGPQSLAESTSPAGSAVVARSGDRLVVDAARLLPWVVMAWAIGALLCSMRLAGGWWQARRLVRLGTRPVAAHWDHVKDTLAARLDLTRTVRLLESTRLQVPVVVGWLRPVLLVPTAVLGGLPAQQLEAIIAHELAHIRRHDYVVNLLQSAVETLLFYHPAVWWVSSAVRTEREHCCDDLAVVACGDAMLYARALTAIEMMRHEEMGVAMAVTGSPLLARVRRLLGVKPPPTSASSGWIVALLTAVMVSGAGVTSWMRSMPVEFAGGAQTIAPQPGDAHEAIAAEAARDQRRDVSELAPDRESERALDRAMASQERALEASARAMEQAQQAAAVSQARGASVEAHNLAREAMRQAHQMARSATRAAHDALRAMGAMRDAQRAARSSSWSWSSDAAPGAPEPPSPPEPPSAPEALDAPMAPPPAPPAPPAVPAPPAPPAPPDGFAYSSGKDASWNVTQTSNGTTLKINAKGTIDFTDDDRDIKSISPGGVFVVERRVGGVGGFFATDVKRFEARERNGDIERTFTVDGRVLAADEGRAWLATFLPETLRNMAVNADKRVARQLAKGGPALVLDEIGKTGGGFGKSAHLRQLYKQAQLDQTMLTRSLQLATHEIDSDFERGQALKGAIATQTGGQSIQAIVEASRSIESDFEQRQVLGKAIGWPGLTSADAAQIFKAATPGPGDAGIESDFELAQLLKAAAREGRVTDENIAAYLDAARAVESDFERRNVVQSLSKAKLSDASMARIVTLAAGIGSDFEKSEAIVGLSRHAAMGSASKKALADAAMGIGSEFERGRALNALTRAGVLSAAQ